MAKRPLPSSVPKRRSDAEVEAARRNFIFAMEELAEERIPNNPLSALVEEVLPAWQQAGASANPVTTSTRFRYISAEERRESEAVKRDRRREIIEQWARRFGLVSGAEPADWIVGYAENLCLKLSGEFREEPTTLGHHGSAQDQKRQAPPWLGGLLVPMTDPYQREGESIAQFKKRARKALTAHLKKLAVRDQSETALLKQQNSIRKPHELDHYKWLLLRRCGWKLNTILQKYPVVHSVQAIRHGIQRKAALLGLALPK